MAPSGMPNLARAVSVSSTEALKSAEALFESKNIAEIREVEAKTKGEIDDKKRQLRRLVGDSYRDLIEGADKIVAIAKTCDTILANVTNIQGSFSTLTSSITTATWGTGEKKESLKRHEELFAVGSRVKYLVDTPEMIWGCLDAQSYLEAARRYLRAQEVHRLLQSGFSADLLARFPLLSHQWPQVLKFKQQILAAVKASLSTGPVQPVSQVADALAAAAALESLDSAAALQLLLSSRGGLMRQLLASAAAEPQPVGAVGELLSSWAGIMQQTITQVAEVFLEKGGGQAGPHLLRVLRAADQQESSGLFFTFSPSSAAGTASSGGGVDAAGGQVSAEASAWASRQREVEARLVPQAAGQVEQACSSWVAQLAEELLEPAAQLLATCTEAEHLCQVERTLRQAIAAWSAKAPAGSARAAPVSEARASWDGAAAAAAAAAAGSAAGESWEEVCEWVLGRPLGAWQELFHAPLLKRAKDVVALRFLAVREGVAASIEACLQEAAAAPVEPAGLVACPSWPQFWGPPATTSAPAAAAPASGQLPAEAPSTSGKAPVGAPPGFRQRVHHIRQQLDADLQDTLTTCLALLDTPTAPATAPPAPPFFDPAGPLGHRQGSLARGAAGGRDASGRAAELEPFIQQQCADVAAALSQLLKDRFDQLPTPDPRTPESARTVEQGLLVARLCLALSTESRGLQLLLGPPDAWRPQASPASLLAPHHHSLAHGRGPKGPQQSPRHQALAAGFSATAHAAFRQWAQWSAAALSAQLLQGLLGDEVLRLGPAPPSWAETVLSAAVDEGGEEGGGEMRFSLPACPSVAVYSMLDSACQETRRAGGNTLGTEALQVLEWELLGAALQVFQELLQEAGAFAAAVSERGVLQLLFDLRFLRDVLAGGRPLLDRPPAPPQAASKYLPEVQDPAVTAALAERRRQWGGVEGSLQERLDPIDWATYEPYLWANAEKYYHRCSVLLGTLGQLQRAYPEAAGKVQPSQELNPLNLLPVVSRFQYLPISAPTQLHANAAHPRASATHLYAKLGAYTPANPSLDESYSFANLGRVKDAAAAAAAAADGADGSSATSTLGALQARLQAGSLGTLGTMLGDKAAEMTAMAQQRFETISLSDLSGGLLSSFAKGVVRAPLQQAGK